jgi:hypothetical protein
MTPMGQLRMATEFLFPHHAINAAAQKIKTTDLIRIGRRYSFEDGPAVQR